jgi:hypothetical protein
LAPPGAIVLSVPAFPFTSIGLADRRDGDSGLAEASPES